MFRCFKYIQKQFCFYCARGENIFAPKLFNVKTKKLYPFLKTPLINGADVTEYRLEWGGVEGSMQICYCGPGLSCELKGLSPATAYYCRVQVGDH